MIRNRNKRLYLENFDPYNTLKNYNSDQKFIKWIQRYIRFIQSRVHRQINEPVTRMHHIVPVSWGGPDNPENLIELTIKEHIIAHHLLSKTGDRSAHNAFLIMISNNMNAFNYNITINLLTEAIENVANDLGRPVVNLNTQQIYPSIAMASRSVNRNDTAVGTAIRLKRRCGGYYWEYVDQFEDKITPESIQQKLDLIETCKQQNRRSWKETHCSPIVNLTSKELFLHLNDAASVYGGSGHNLKDAATKCQKAWGCWWATLDQLDDLSSKTIEERIKFLEEHISFKRKERNKKCIKAIINKTTGEIFTGGVYEVAQKYNLNCLGWISKCCRENLKLRGCYWEYCE